MLIDHIKELLFHGITVYEGLANISNNGQRCFVHPNAKVIVQIFHQGILPADGESVWLGACTKARHGA